jgi:protein-tyrosine phosphatase
MPFRPLPLPAPVPGAVWLHSMPGRLERWDAFVAEAARTGLTLTVCLTPRHEIASMAPAYDAALRQGTMPTRWLHLPMRDFGLSENLADFRAGIDDIATRLQGGEVVLLHCAAGIGRTGTVAACVLKRLGVAREHARQQVLAAGSNPESALQAGLVDSF